MRRRRTYSRYFGRWRQFFDTYEGAGIHVLPAHFYSPVPDTRELLPDRWERRTPMTGITIDMEAVHSILGRIIEYKSEYSAFAAEGSDPQEFAFNNTAYCAGEAEVLYAMVRMLRPRRVVEIGTGHTTLLTAAACRRNATEDGESWCEFISIDPHAPEYVRDLPGLTKLIKLPVQEVDLGLFSGLGPGDILFIDSSHVLRMGNDVAHEYLEILPSIGEGVVVHVHDIFLPMEYPEDWVREARFFWNEQYLLQAILAQSSRWKVMWPGHLMHLDHGKELERAFPQYDRATCRPSCWWMRRCSDTAAGAHR
jgi:hypothetical protein